MSKKVNQSGWLKNYGLLIAMLVAIVAGCIVGFIFPATDGSAGATVLAPLGKVFINLMFCIVVPMVFSSIASAVANMGSRKRAGKIMGVTVGTFVVTGAI
ncbi:MAG: cation:dicarboxylate symporter family transporter, partial [Candidatus Avoscillospira sp.]